MALLDLVKAHLRIDGDEHDTLLQHLIASATAECRRFTGLSADAAELSEPDIQTGILLAVQADFDGNPAQRTVYLRAAQALWTPFCRQFGV